MRKKRDYVRISVSKETHVRLKEDRDHFQATIGGGKWGIDDTILEYIKILNLVKEYGLDDKKCLMSMQKTNKEKK